MACERFREALADVAAGAPPPAGVGAHLGACEACREELEALRRVLGVVDEELAGLAAAEPSPDLRARVLRAAAESEASPAFRLGWLWPAAAAAVAVLVGVAVWTGRTPVVPRDTVASGPEGPAVPVPAIPTDSGSPVPVIPGASGSPVPVIPGDTVAPGPSGSAVPAAGPVRAARSARARRDVPEVLVPAGEQERLLQLVALVHREQLSLVALSAAGEASGGLAEPSPIDTPPLEIVPLDPAEPSGT